jgi:hypothetical protein
VGIKFEGEPPFDLGVAQTVSAQVLDATVVLRVTVVVPERRSKPVPVRFTMTGGTCKGISRAIWDRCDNGRANPRRETKRGRLFLIDFAFSA